MTDKLFGSRVIAPTGVAATDTAAWNSWFTASPRPPLWFAPTGNKFIVDAAPTVNNASSGLFYIEGNGVELVQKFSSAPFLNVQRTMTAPQSTATDAEDVNFATADDAALNLVTRVRLTTPAEVANFPAGTLVLLTSENIAPHASAGPTPADEGGRMGQVLRVSKIDAVSGYVYFATTAWRSDLYVTDIRLTAMPVGDTYVNNIKLSIEAGAAENLEARLQPVMWFTNCLHPTFTNIDIIESSSLGAVFSRVVGGKFSHNRIRKIRSSLINTDGPGANGRSGYGVLLTGCDGMALSDNWFTNVRHGISSNWTNSVAAGAVHRHGATMNCLIANNTVAFPKGGGIDTHSDAVNCLITGNLVYGARSDATGGGYGYQMRGEANVMVGNTDYDCENGVQIFENTADGSQDCRLINHVSVAKKVALTFSGHVNSTRKMNCQVIGGVFESKQIGAGVGRMVVSERAKINFKGSIFKPRGQNGGSLFEVTVNGNTDISGDIVYDPQNVAGDADWDLLTTAGSGNTFAVTVKRDADDGVGANAAYVVADFSPDVISFAVTLTADRAVTFACTGRKRVMIKRTATGAFNLNVTHSGGTLALGIDEAAVFEVHGAVVMLVSPTISL